MNTRLTLQSLSQRLKTLYDDGEARAVVRLLLEKQLGLSWTDVLCGRLDELTDVQQHLLEDSMQRLEQGEPVQYVLGEAEFGGRSFHVEPGVLIPRPETYELCEWILSTLFSPPSSLFLPPSSLLDIGTGSGCIACTLAAELPDAQVTAWDISDDALRIARQNAKLHHVNVEFEKVDILQIAPSLWGETKESFSVIVSNPPYVCLEEATSMEPHVLEYEPKVALFVPDNDPLVFYRAIAKYAQQALKPDGWLYFEINPRYAEPLVALLEELQYDQIELKSDSFGKKRMIRACKETGK